MKFNFKKLRIPKTELRSFLLTLVATLVGVFIAISLTNSGARKKEKEDTIKLLKTSKLILQNTKKYSEELSKTFKNLQKDTVKYNAKTISDLKTNNPIPFPYLLETVITNEIISKNISEYSHSFIYNSLINLKKLAHHSTNETYNQLLSDLIALMDIEIEYQKGKLNLSEIQNKVAKISEELNKTNVEEDEKILKIISK